MIGYIKGCIEEIGQDYIIADNNGIGYKLFVSSNTIAKLSVGDDAKIFSKMIVREDDISLCGFHSKEEMEMYELLTSVSKIGMKVGLAILSFATPSKLNRFILSNDTTSLSKAPGVGKKTAERIVLELKDKVAKTSIIEDDESDIFTHTNVSSLRDEATQGLMALGYSAQESERAVRFVKQPGMGTEDIIKKALEYILKTGSRF